MAVTFVIGRAGSGKTARCYGRIAAALRADPLGPPVFLLVPKQATFQAERELTAATGGFIRLRVVSFELLGRQVAADCGNAAVPEVTPIGRQMILGHLLRRHQAKLEFFAGVARRPGLAAELDATFAEFERSGKTSADLTDLLDQLRHADPGDAQGPSLQAKLRDLRYLYDEYTRYLGQERLDQHRRLTQVLSQLEGCSLLRGATVYVDDFYDFTDDERRILAGLGRACAAVEICLTIDPHSPTVRDPHHLPDEMGLCYRTEEAYRRLWFAMADVNVAVTGPVRLEGVRRFEAPELTLVEREAFATPGEGNAESGTLNAEWNEDIGSSALFSTQHSSFSISTPALRLIECPDLHGEVEAAARGIRELLRRGLRLRDVAVLVRDLEPYQRLIDVTFREHGLPFFVDRRRSAAHHPLLVFVRSMFQIARNTWPAQAVMALLKSGLAGVTTLEADEIENYLIQHRLRGSAWDSAEGWAYQRRLTADDEAAPPEEFEVRDVDALRRGIVGRLRPLLDKVNQAGATPIRYWAVVVFQVFEKFNVRGALSAWAAADAAAGELEQAGEHEQVWAELVSLFEQMVDLLGEEPVTAAEFVDVLESGLDRFDLALTPPTVDQVLVGQVDRTRTPALRAAFVLGLNEGQFPYAARDVTILSHAERRELRRRKIDLDPDPGRRLLDERFLGYVAFTRASDWLTVSRSLSDEEGKPAEPSPYWQRLRELFPAREPVRIGRGSHDPRDVRHIATPRQLVASLMAWAREAEGGDTEGNSAGPASARGNSPASGERCAKAHPTLSPDPSSAFSTQHSAFPDDPRPALYQWLASRPPCGDALDLARYRAWKALAYANEAHLSPEIARELFPAPLRASVGQIETFAACPFRHFLRYGIRLRGREGANVTALDLSQVYHQVLEILAGEVLENHAGWKDLPAERARELIHEFGEAVARQLRGELMLSSARNRYILQRIENTLEAVVASLREMESRSRFRTARTGITFGDSGILPPYQVRTPGGNEIRLSGQIDRIDLLGAKGGGADGAAASEASGEAPAVAVFDYRLSAGPLPLGNLYHGLSLQLLTYLLVLQSHGEQLVGKPLTPAAAFYYQVLRGLSPVDHPDDAIDPADPRFHLRHKPRGVFHGKYFDALDAEAAPGEASNVVAAHLKKDGQFGYRDKSDVADAHEFAALLSFVHARLGRIGDQIMAGDVGLSPYRIGRKTPCPQCEFRPVCRFEPGVNSYRHLVPLRRQDALEKIAGGGAEGGKDSEGGGGGGA